MQVLGGKAMLMQYMIFIFKVVVSKNVSKMHQTRCIKKLNIFNLFVQALVLRYLSMVPTATKAKA